MRPLTHIQNQPPMIQKSLQADEFETEGKMQDDAEDTLKENLSEGVADASFDDEFDHQPSQSRNIVGEKIGLN